jgi:hypothetical protein
MLLGNPLSTSLFPIVHSQCFFVFAVLFPKDEEQKVETPSMATSLLIGNTKSQCPPGARQLYLDTFLPILAAIPIVLPYKASILPTLAVVH